MYVSTQQQQQQQQQTHLLTYLLTGSAHYDTDRSLREEVMLPAGYDPARQLGGP